VLTIGRLADAAGVNVETIRYYERRGLLDEPARTRSGYRQYGSDALWRLTFIARAKSLGFTLAEVKQLLDSGSTSDAVLAATNAKLRAISERLAELEETRVRLEVLAQICASGDADCTTLAVRPIRKAPPRGVDDLAHQPDASPALRRRR
jgi:DNA-binding transcriptional MerR regulator